jgi:serine/threonine protein kinase
MMVLEYCKNGNLRNYLNQTNDIGYDSKIDYLLQIARGLLDIHNAGKVHKDFHSGNILFNSNVELYNVELYVSDLGMCQPANNEEQSVKKGVYGVLPYMAPEEQTALCRVVTFIHIYITRRVRTVITLY